MFDTTRHQASSIFFRFGQYFGFTSINSENIVSHEHIAQNNRSMFRTLSEMFGKPVLSSSQTDIITKSATEMAVFSSKFSDTTQFKTIFGAYKLRNDRKKH